MFYCEKCQVENKWPKAWAMSHGKCECCGAVGACFDRPSSSLPALPKPPTDTERLDFLIAEECRIEVLPPMPKAGVKECFRLRWEDLGEHQSEWYPSARDAIDTAIKDMQRKTIHGLPVRPRTERNR